jgi:electron transfer flavoprotein alpha subunit
VTVLCLVETDGAGAADVSLRALTFARGLAQPAGESVAAVAFGPVGPGRVAEPLTAAVAAFGAADVYAVTADGLDGYAPQAWGRALAGLAAETGASAVVAAGTDHGAEVLAHLGAITGLPVAANCAAAVRGADGSYQLIRHRWVGSLLEDAVLDSSPALLTVAVDAVPAEPVPGEPLPAEPVPAEPVPAEPVPAGSAAAGTAAVHEYRAELDQADLVAVARESAERSGGISLASARVVVGGGRGVGGPEGFGPLEELAGLLGGVVGVSRVVTSQGWRPHKQQVGQTGTRISPELYLACGISGAIQHMAGCLSAKHIIAVNTDPDAPIISHADYAVIGDLNQVIPALIAALRARDGASRPG